MEEDSPDERGPKAPEPAAGWPGTYAPASGHVAVGPDGSPAGSSSASTQGLDVGELVRTCARIFRENALLDAAFLLIVGFGGMLVGLLPIAAIGTVALAQKADLERMFRENPSIVFALAAAGLFAFVFAMLAFSLATAGVLHHALAAIEGRRSTFAGMVKRALSRLPAMLGVTIVQGLIVFAGMVLCLLPGIYAAVCCVAATPAVVHRRIGVIDAVRTSFDLTRGHRFEVFLLYALIFAAAMGLGFANSCVSSFAMVPVATLMGEGERSAGAIALGILGGLVWLVFYLLGNVLQQLAFAYAQAATYARLANVDRSVDGTEIARVFT